MTTMTTDYTANGYFQRTITAVEADDFATIIDVTASPTDDPRVLLDIHGRIGADAPLIEILALEPDQVDAMIEALTGARDYLRAQAAEHQRSAPIVVATDHAVEYKFDCSCGYGTSWHLTEELARQEHGAHAAAPVNTVAV